MDNFKEITKYQAGMEDKKKSKSLDDPIVAASKAVDEVSTFLALGDALRSAIKEKFGVEWWIVDFSDKQVVFKKNDDEQHKKIEYRVSNKEVELVGTASDVKKLINYESIKQAAKRF